MMWFSALTNLPLASWICQASCTIRGQLLKLVKGAFLSSGRPVVSVSNIKNIATLLKIMDNVRLIFNDIKSRNHLFKTNDFFWNKDGYGNIFFSDNFYNSFIGVLREKNKNKNVDSWFTKYKDEKFGCFYDCDIIKTDFNDWIENEMKG